MTMKDYLEAQLASLIAPVPTSPTVSNAPKLILVNGLHNKYIPSVPDDGGPTYWDDFNGVTFVNAAISYFNSNGSSIGPISIANDVKYADGSDLLSFASGRMSSGIDWAEANIGYLTSNSSEVLDFYIITHSQGGAYGVGIANYLITKGHTIKELVFLSPYQGVDISVDPDLMPAYHLLYAEWNSLGVTNILVVDIVVGDQLIDGVKRYGIALRPDLPDRFLHGRSKTAEVFSYLSDLKNVIVTPNTNSHGQKFYSQSYPPTNNGTEFYEICDLTLIGGTNKEVKKIIAPNNPGWNPSTQTIN